MPHFNHGVHLGGGSSLIAPDSTPDLNFARWQTFKEDGFEASSLGGPNGGDSMTDHGPQVQREISPLQADCALVGSSLMFDLNVSCAPLSTRPPVLTLSAFECPPKAQSSMADDTSANRSSQQWIPIPLDGIPNIYSSAFFAAIGTNHIQPRGLEILRRASSASSGTNRLSPHSICLSETRRETLSILYEWASQSASATGSILWVKGPMGVGKSTIVRTLTQGLHAQGRLGGYFVLSRGRRALTNADALVCALAYQIAINIPHLRVPISRAVRKNPAVLGETMGVQLQELILEPLRAGVVLNPVSLLNPLVLVIDGLDECQYNIQREILSLLGLAIQNQPPLRIVFATRPDDRIAEILADPAFSDMCRSLDVERSYEDIRTYLCVEFARIQHHRFGSLSSPWISPRIIESLLEASSGCFIYASTLSRFLCDAIFSPLERLTVVQSLPINHITSPLDSLYTQILDTVPAGSHVSLFALLHILATETFADLPCHHIEQLLHMKPGRLPRILQHLRAILHVPDSDNGAGIAVYHPSFLEFLIDPARSGAFCIAGAQHSMYLGRCILKSLAYTHDNPHVNRVGHIAWNHLSAMVDYVITSMEPSPDLVPLIRRINPDFFFASLDTFDEIGTKMTTWLNKMQPRSEEAIGLWEDYTYMAFFHSAVNDFDFDEGSVRFNSTKSSKRQQFLLRHPLLIRLLRVSMALPALTPLFPFRVLLGASWDDLRTVVCGILRPAYGCNDTALSQLWECLQDPGFARDICPWSTVFRDLACQSIRIARNERAGTAPMELVGYWLEWGRYVRSSPPCFELLRELRDFVPCDGIRHGLETGNEVYDVLKWLESFPGSPQEERLRWAGYLQEGTELERDPQAFAAHINSKVVRFKEIEHILGHLGDVEWLFQQQPFNENPRGWMSDSDIFLSFDLLDSIKINGCATDREKKQTVQLAR
ncbi:hypothetical protein C8R43DRAFT_1209378 [Mycena crocata]|nr:hypothetical protein C8R43DRAFT_1209378 [Mycena crocata]